MYKTCKTALNKLQLRQKQILEPSIVVRNAGKNDTSRYEKRLQGEDINYIKTSQSILLNNTLK